MTTTTTTTGATRPVRLLKTEAEIKQCKEDLLTLRRLGYTGIEIPPRLRNITEAELNAEISRLEAL